MNKNTKSAMKAVLYMLPFLASLLAGVPTRAQEKGTALPFVRIDRDPASAGIAGASMTSTESMAYASFANPAAMVYSDRKFDFNVGYQQQHIGGASDIPAGARDVGQGMAQILNADVDDQPQQEEIQLTFFVEFFHGFPALRFLIDSG